MISVPDSNYHLWTIKLAGIVLIGSTTTMTGAVPAHAACNDRLLIGEDFRLTIHSAKASGQQGTEDSKVPDRKAGTVCGMFERLRGCWAPPSGADARPGIEITVRFSFKRDGEMIAAPRVTYVTPATSAETRATYLAAIKAALDRCTPMHFTERLAAVVVGHPIAIRFVDDRTEFSQ